jgi:phosphoenolpyruvate carboxykinase (ATP)
MPIDETRSIVRAILSRQLDEAPLRRESHFHLHVPERVPGVRAEVLDPRAADGDVDRYDERARALAARFAENYAQYQR